MEGKEHESKKETLKEEGEGKGGDGEGGGTSSREEEIMGARWDCS